MSWQVIVRAKAKSDLENARDWYDRQQKGLGDEFLSAVHEGFAVLEQNPHVCQIFYKKFRQFLTPRFPYRTIYFVDGSKVVVARVFHSQDFTQHI